MEVIMEIAEKKPLPASRTDTVEKIAAILNIGRTTAYILVKEGHFKVVRIANAIRISKKSFDEWLDSWNCNLTQNAIGSGAYGVFPCLHYSVM
jgi:excisionase family DNA binding protein